MRSAGRILAQSVLPSSKRKRVPNPTGNAVFCATRDAHADGAHATCDVAECTFSEKQQRDSNTGQGVPRIDEQQRGCALATNLADTYSSGHLVTGAERKQPVAHHECDG